MKVSDKLYFFSKGICYAVWHLRRYPAGRRVRIIQPISGEISPDDFSLLAPQMMPHRRCWQTQSGDNNPKQNKGGIRNEEW
jgi:hypothetical protein